MGAFGAIPCRMFPTDAPMLAQVALYSVAKTPESTPGLPQDQQPSPHKTGHPLPKCLLQLTDTGSRRDGHIFLSAAETPRPMPNLLVCQTCCRTSGQLEPMVSRETEAHVALKSGTPNTPETRDCFCRDLLDLKPRTLIESIKQ